MNLAACATLGGKGENSTWYRAVLNPFAASAFNYSHTLTARSRFNAGSHLSVGDRFPAFYLAGDAITALFEVGAMLGSNRPGASVPNPNVAHTIYNVQVNLHSVIDLSDINAQAILSTSVQELTGDWQGYNLRSNLTPVKSPTGEAPTQALGRSTTTPRMRKDSFPCRRECLTRKLSWCFRTSWRQEAR